MVALAEWRDGCCGAAVRASDRLAAFGHAQDFHPGRSEQELAEVLHQAGNVLARVAAMAHPLELVEAVQLDLELQRGAALTAGQGHQQAGVAAVTASGLDLTADKVDRALTVGGQHIVGEAGEVHRTLLSEPAAVLAGPGPSPNRRRGPPCPDWLRRAHLAGEPDPRRCRCREVEPLPTQG